MELEKLLKAICDYLDSIEKPFEKDDKIGIIFWVIRMSEDGLTWEEIREELEVRL